jgi:shikimate kinase
MGSGKSTLGKKLARELSMPFVDLDFSIAEEMGSTIAEIFEQHGEQFFRKKEHETLKRILEQEGSLVMSVGGGAPCFFDNMQLMNAAGTTVFIHMPPAALADRLNNAKEQRPLLQRVPPEELENFIANHLEERMPYYSQAKFTMQGISAKPQDILLLLEHGAP